MPASRLRPTLGRLWPFSAPGALLLFSVLVALPACGGGDEAEVEAGVAPDGFSTPAPGAPADGSPLPPGLGVGPGGVPSFDEVDQATLALLMESQELQARLSALSDRVLEEPDLARELEALQTRIDGVFRERNPGLVETMARYQAEFDAARSAGDREAQQRIQFEVAEVREALARAQQAVLEDPEVAAAIQVFEARQRARIVERHPEADTLFARLDALERQIGAALGVPTP